MKSAAPSSASAIALARAGVTLPLLSAQSARAAARRTRASPSRSSAS
eukprot:CAMPEP_0119163048 /NCGR_PEP_ID=MMETSP1315-20130426/3062_1 /TAXON_ID=676789 /ORGANISM="Prasinoderma singularis, Strain RCC927" /LENGTH=46 /DNA_ID= /DNA_START= /DNA_END= /DNA_ORIENTATION=